MRWRAHVKGDDYVIQVTVSNQDKSVNRSKTVTVISLDKPVVNIIYPKEQDYLVQFDTVVLEAEAFHDNGISTVELFINDSSITEVDGKSSNKYEFNWVVNTAAGEAEIKVAAKARVTSASNADSLTVNIEGVIPGKK